MLNSFLKQSISILLIICASFFVEEALIGFWYRFIGLPLFGEIKSSPLFDVASLVSLIAVIIFSLSQSHRFSKKLFYCSLIYTILYLELRVFGNKNLTLTPFYTSVLHWAVYADIVVLGMWAYVLSSKRRKNIVPANQTPRNSLYFEDVTNGEDLLGHIKQASVLTHLLKTEYAHSENSVGIAVTGEWGAGKSTFLSYLKESLTDCICINFDPWTENSKNVENDLFDRIEQEISQRNPVLGNSFKRYFDKVNVTNVTGWFGLVILSIKNFIDSETAEDRKENLKQSLRSLKNPIVIFIDDSDRLPDDEFLRVISIIRGIADLPNLVFFVAFDQSRANDKLKEYGGQDFMCKLFNVIHPLQPISPEIILNVLVENISSILTDKPEEKESYKSFISDAFSFLPIKSFIPTLRELKRFCNVVEKDFRIIEHNEAVQFIDIHQWLLVELLKFTDISLWNMIAMKPELYLKEESLYGLNSSYLILKDDVKFSKEQSGKLLYTLFHHPLGQVNDTFLINNTKYFSLYYGHPIPDSYISSEIVEEYSILKSDDLEIRNGKAKKLKDFISKNWAIHEKTNIESIVGEILKSYPVELLYPILEQIAKEYLTNKKGRTLQEIGERDNYRKYVKIIEAHPFLSVLSFKKLEDFCEFDGQPAVDDSCIFKSEQPLILSAIFNNQIRNWGHEGRICSDGYLFELLKRLVSEGKHQDIIWVVGDCQSAELQKSFLNEYLKTHLLDCLPYMICKKTDSATSEKYIYPNIKAFEALFLSYNGFKKTIESFKWQKLYDESLLKEIQKLVGLSNYTERNPTYFRIESFPLLSTYLSDSQRFLSISHITSDTFWTDGDRIEEVFEYYFV